MSVRPISLKFADYIPCCEKAVFLLAFVFFLQTRQHKIVLRRFLASAKENRFPVGLFLLIKYIRIGLHVGKH